MIWGKFCPPTQILLAINMHACMYVVSLSTHCIIVSSRIPNATERVIYFLWKRYQSTLVQVLAVAFRLCLFVCLDHFDVVELYMKGMIIESPRLFRSKCPTLLVYCSWSKAFLNRQMISSTGKNAVA